LTHTVGSAFHTAKLLQHFPLPHFQSPPCPPQSAGSFRPVCLSELDSDRTQCLSLYVLVFCLFVMLFLANDYAEYPHSILAHVKLSYRIVSYRIARKSDRLYTVGVKRQRSAKREWRVIVRMRRDVD